MNLQEFKAWLDGFSAAIDGAPTAEQWETIKAKLAETQALRFDPAPDPLRYVPQWPNDPIITGPNTCDPAPMRTVWSS